MAYVTLAQLRLELGAEATTDDALLTSKIARAQAIGEALSGRVFEATTATRYYDAVLDVEGADLRLDYPLLTVTKITNGDTSEVTSDQYVLLPANLTQKWKVRLKGSKGINWTFTGDPENAISVAGTWGHATAAPEDVQEATLQLAAYLYKLRDSPVREVITLPGGQQIEVPAGVPKFVYSVFRSYRNML